MSYKPTGRPPGRPRYLPDLNPEIPPCIAQEFPTLEAEVQRAITATKGKQHNADLLWLNLTRKFRNRLFASHRILSGQFNSLTLSNEQIKALEYLQKKGRYVWQRQSRRQVATSLKSTTVKVNASKA